MLYLYLSLLTQFQYSVLVVTSQKSVLFTTVRRSVSRRLRSARPTVSSQHSLRQLMWNKCMKCFYTSTKTNIWLSLKCSSSNSNKCKSIWMEITIREKKTKKWQEDAMRETNKPSLKSPMETMMAIWTKGLLLPSTNKGQWKGSSNPPLSSFLNQPWTAKVLFSNPASNKWACSNKCNWTLQ